MPVPQYKAPGDLLSNLPFARVLVQALCPQAFVTGFVAGVCSVALFQLWYFRLVLYLSVFVYFFFFFLSLELDSCWV